LNTSDEVTWSLSDDERIAVHAYVVFLILSLLVYAYYLNREIGDEVIVGVTLIEWARRIAKKLLTQRLSSQPGA